MSALWPYVFVGEREAYFSGEPNDSTASDNSTSLGEKAQHMKYLVRWNLKTGEVNFLEQDREWHFFIGSTSASTILIQGGRYQELLLRNFHTGEERYLWKGPIDGSEQGLIYNGAVSQNKRFAVFHGSFIPDGPQTWLVRLQDLKAVKVCSGKYVGLGGLSPDGKKICMYSEGTRLFWWRMDPDSMTYALIPKFYVIDIGKAYADLDGPKAFYVKDKLKGEWFPLGEQAGK